MSDMVITDAVMDAFVRAYHEQDDGENFSHSECIRTGLAAAINASEQLRAEREELVRLRTLAGALDSEQMNANEERDALMPLARLGLWVRDVKLPEDERDIEQMLCCKVVVDDGDGGITDTESTTLARKLLTEARDE